LRSEFQPFVCSGYALAQYRQPIFERFIRHSIVTFVSLITLNIVRCDPRYLHFPEERDKEGIEKVLFRSLFRILVVRYHVLLEPLLRKSLESLLLLCYVRTSVYRLTTR